MAKYLVISERASEEIEDAYAWYEARSITSDMQM